MRECQIEVAQPCPAAQCAQPRGERTRLAEPRSSTMPADDRRLEPVQLEQLQRLRIVAGRDLDLVATLVEETDQRPEDEDMRRRRQVQPDLQAGTSTRS